MVQYHALGVLYHIKKADRLAVTKLVSKLTKSHLKSPFAVSLLIRISAKLVDEEDNPIDSPFFDFLEACLRHKSELVIFEAAHAIINLKRITSREINPAVSVLQLFCSSPKPALRFAAVRTLNKVAITHPASVTNCNVDLENLITDSNRSIATLAITTLLKTGAESSIDRLMKQIASFVSEISDEFKIVVVAAIKSICLKFPRKHNTLMSFLSALLRDEGGLDYKAAIADTIITIIEENPEAKETGLSHLCEFIEDCEHTSLAVRILHLLGREGPKAKHPSKYIRYIYNRVILEQPPVRAAAVAALAQFAACCPNLLSNILVLLKVKIKYTI
jgi:coatomer protein complex subunit gamma